MTGVTSPSLQTLTQAVMDGTLTILDRPEWMPASVVDDLHQANAGASDSAMRFAAALCPDWTWRIGYDGKAEMAYRPEPEVCIEVISLTPAHALLLASLHAKAREEGLVAPERR